MADATLLDYSLLDNPATRWLAAIGVASAAWLFAALFQSVVVRRLAWLAERTSTAIDNSLVDALAATRLWLWLLPSLYAGSLLLTLPPRSARLLAAAATVSALLQFGLWGGRLVEYWSRQSHRGTGGSDVATTSSMAALRFIGKVLVWAVVLLLALDNIGIDVTAAVAGLGIGGIAVALAVQNVLGDLFASLSIVIDKPFEIGDFVIVDSYMGTVEAIGLKTTRIRSLGGEQLVFSNTDLLTSRLRNYRRMYERRVAFKFGVTYQTPPDLLEAIPPLVKSIVTALETVRFERAHLVAFGDSALEFEVVYWVLDPDYGLYADRHQAINLALLREFASRGVEFAYPTRTLFVSQLPAAD